MQYGFYFNGSRCIGCRTCVFACKDLNDLNVDFTFRHIYEYEGGTWAQDGDAWMSDMFSYHVSLACNHCDDPACVEACPTGAMHRDGETGLVIVDAGVCIGCGYCHMACPYNAPQVDRSKGVSVKCDGCISRVREGKQPVCVESCSLRCLEFGPIEELRAAHGDEAGIAPLPDPALTHPNLVVTPPANARPFDDVAGHIANKTEVL